MKHDEFIEDILKDLSDLNRNIAIDKSLSYLSPEQLDALFEQFDLLDSQVFDHKRISNNSQKRLDHLSFVMAQIANLNFDFDAYIGDEDNHLDHIAFSVNMMRDRLEEKIKHFQLVEKVMNVDRDILLTTDESGEILFSNARASYLGIKPNVIQGKNIRSFILSNLFIFNYSIDLDFDDEFHELRRDFVENKDSKIVLHISRKKIKSSNEETYFLYRIQALNSSVYKRPASTHEDVNVIQTIYDLTTQCQSHKHDRKKILMRLKKILKSQQIDPLNQQLLENIDLMLKRISS